MTHQLEHAHGSIGPQTILIASSHGMGENKDLIIEVTFPDGDTTATALFKVIYAGVGVKNHSATFKFYNQAVDYYNSL